MTAQQRQLLLAAVLILLLIAATFWSFGRCREAHRAMRQASHDTQRSLELASAIQMLRTAPTLRGGDELDEPELTRMIQTAAQAVGVDPHQTVRSIRPMPPRQVTGAPYQQYTTEVRLARIAMPQLVSLLNQLTIDHPGLRIDHLHLAGPEGDGPGARWNVEPATLTYLIYRPPTSPSGDHRW